MNINIEILEILSRKISEINDKSNSGSIILDVNKEFPKTDPDIIRTALNILSSRGLIQYQEHFVTINTDTKSEDFVEIPNVFKINVFSELKTISESRINKISYKGNTLCFDSDCVKISPKGRRSALIKFLFGKKNYKKYWNVDEILEVVEGSKFAELSNTLKGRFYETCDSLNKHILTKTKGKVTDFLDFSHNHCQINPKYTQLISS